MSGNEVSEMVRTLFSGSDDSNFAQGRHRDAQILNWNLIGPHIQGGVFP